ncbi:hypothetical protein LJC10_01740 [Selenomonadales bacterium OttesenSCG-928-I06]|nr:hypothetical protein [Selenomonadales bacterium OttesenSCG-928-I06]
MVREIKTILGTPYESPVVQSLKNLTKKDTFAEFYRQQKTNELREKIEWLAVEKTAQNLMEPMNKEQNKVNQVSTNESVGDMNNQEAFGVILTEKEEKNYADEASKQHIQYKYEDTQQYESVEEDIKEAVKEQSGSDIGSSGSITPVYDIKLPSMPDEDNVNLEQIDPSKLSLDDWKSLGAQSSSIDYMYYTLRVRENTHPDIQKYKDTKYNIKKLKENLSEEAKKAFEEGEKQNDYYDTTVSHIPLIGSIAGLAAAHKNYDALIGKKMDDFEDFQNKNGEPIPDGVLINVLKKHSSRSGSWIFDEKAINKELAGLGYSYPVDKQNYELHQGPLPEFRPAEAKKENEGYSKERWEHERGFNDRYK